MLTQEELDALGARVLALSTADTVEVTIEHKALRVARVRENEIRLTSDGSTLTLALRTQYGQGGDVRLDTNRLDDASLRAAITYAERLAQDLPHEPYAIHTPAQRHPIPPATIWHDSTATALVTTQHTIVPALIDAVAQAGLVSSAFVGASARSVLYLTKDGVHLTGQETDAEVVLTVWSPDASGVGWSGQAARDWAVLDPHAVAAEAIGLALQAAQPMAVEPGRRTVILGPAAVAQFAHLMAYAWDARDPFTPLAGKVGQRVMDARITIKSDPNDPEGGFLPFYREQNDGSPVIPMTWVEHGVLTNLAFDPWYAASIGRSSSNDVPRSFRLGQGIGTIRSMIAECREGIYVNRVADLVMLNSTSGTMTGVTQGGCFLVKDGKIARPLKNLRFVDSPFVFLNNVIEIGVPHRAALGYTPGKDEWPLPPIIVPPVMVRDFNFTMLADAV